MAQRSPYNDRYKTDQKGKTRKSASAAKPKRALADVTPSQAAKASRKKQSLWSRAKNAGSSGQAARQEAIRIDSTPRMKRLRRIWWWLWGGALGVAVIILAMQQLKIGSPALVGGAWVVWLAAMGGAFFLEFGPIRTERVLAAAAASTAAKPSKSEKAEKPTKGVDADASGSDGTEPPSQDGAE